MTSIITAIYNTYPLLTNFTERLLKCCKDDDEIILIADGIKDVDCLAYLEEISKSNNIRLIKNSQRIGFGASNNSGAKAAHGETLIFLNSDVFPEENCFQIIQKTLWSQKDIGAVQPLLIYPQTNLVQSTGHLFIDYESRYLYKYRKPNDYPILLAGQRQALTLALCAIKTSIFWKFGGLDEYYINSHEGLELTLKIAHNGYKCLYEPKAVAYHSTRESRSKISYDYERQHTHFFAKWADIISFDLVHYLQVQLEEMNIQKHYIAINFSCSRIWPEVLESLNIVTDNFLESEAKYEPCINLYSWLPVYFFAIPTPFLFLCNDLLQLKSNYNWCMIRSNKNDIILDLNGNALQFSNLIMEK